MSDTHQIEAVDRALAAALGGETRENSFAESAAEMAWDRIRFHGIAGLLALQSDAIGHWPSRLTLRIREEARLQAFWEESHRAMLAALLAGLAVRGVESVLMKGTALAYSIYTEPSVRRRGDTDLLVKPQALANARAVFAEQGFTRRADPHGLFFQETWLSDTGIGLVHAIDLHWQPTDSPALQTVLRADAYFARTAPVPRLSPDARMPSPVLTFVQGALNQTWHAHKGYFVEGERKFGGGRLIWAWDNHLLASQFSAADWDELADLAVQRQISAVCLGALVMAQNLCSTAVPDRVIARLRAAPQNTYLVKFLGETNLISSFLVDLRAIRSPLDKCRFALGHALPDAAHLRQKYPRCARWPLALLYLRRIAESLGRLLRLRRD